MAYFPRNFYGSDTSFTPLFRLLDDFDTYTRSQGDTTRGKGNIAFQPKFDVRELEDAYELHGELPGISKENVSIEFSDPHTMLIRGRIERSYTAGTPPAGLVEDTQMSGAITEGGEKPKLRQASVEEESSEQATPSTVAKSEGTKKQQDRAKYWVSERTVGEFSRTFNFPGQIQQDGVSASLKDGILNVRVPKTPKHEARRRIAIE
ncbi:HSP20-like chaperone [Sodiomyces alkalinus F11]|uniref:HSP20-like chaperone n=1 Tax=Sodiomyces alkalinus (strain CBS 110278 / VKM F-3762 / F11) TaxID=1314773 RepID=A0A3N2PR97_SODAK|nr:HSP20-like chaperone [Sodiomyces alkalinus F11]ROT36974.1 HSP20-like chaperone [Sodiomyces alkalinus F11]